MEDFKHLGYFVKVEYNDYDYLYYFIDYNKNIDIISILKDKLKNIENCSSKFYCSSYEIYEILNQQYNKFKISDQFLIKELFSVFQTNNKNDLIFANPLNFTIDTVKIPRHIDQVEKLQLLSNNLLDVDNNLNYTTIDKMIEILQMMQLKE